MKNVRKRLTNLVAISVALVMIVQIFIAKISLATSVQIVTDEAEKEKLLGITSEKAREKSVLGLANEFSIFSDGDITTFASDIEGRIAVNGNASFYGPRNYNWKYQVGCGYNNYAPNTKGTAEVIVNGGVLNLNVLNGSTTTGVTYTAPKTVVAQCLNDTDPTAEVKGWGYSDSEVENFVKADLIDFEEEFNWLKFQSNALSHNAAHNGTVERRSAKYFVPAVYAKGYSSEKNMYEVASSEYYEYRNGTGSSESTIDYERLTREQIIFVGTNEDYNIFNLTVNDFNNYFGGGDSSYDEQLWSASKDIIFNVPADSGIIINIQGTGYVIFKGSYKNNGTIMVDSSNSSATKPTEMVYRRTLVPYTEADIAKDTNISNKFGMYLYDESTNDFVRDSEGNYVLFVDIANDTQNEKCKNILYNAPDATSFSLTNNFAGSILAPNANGSNPSDKPMSSNGCIGHLSGNLVCKSYYGTMEFGYMPTNITINEGEFSINVSKIDKETEEKLPGATLELHSLNIDNVKNSTDTVEDTVVETWVSTAEDKVFKLAPGGYYIVEVSAPEDYEKENGKTYFTVDENGNIEQNVSISKNLLSQDKVSLDEFPYYYENTILPNVEGTANKYRTTSVSFTLTANSDELKGKTYGIHIGENYNSFRNRSVFRGSNNFYTSMPYIMVEEGKEASFPITVYGWGNMLHVEIKDEAGNAVDVSNFTFTNVTANVPSLVEKTFNYSGDNGSKYEKYAISVVNKKIEKVDDVVEDPKEEEPKEDEVKEEVKEEIKEAGASVEITGDEPIVESKAEPTVEIIQTPKVAETKVTTPKTGDKIVIYSLVLLGSIVTFIVTNRKKKDINR